MHRSRESGVSQMDNHSSWSSDCGRYLCSRTVKPFRMLGFAMNFRVASKDESETIVQLFASVFSVSEGEAEGLLVGQLARELYESSDERDLFNFVAEGDGQVVGSIFLSRMVFESDSAAFILAPVAVHSEHHGKGIGRRLIKHGLRELKKRGVNFVLTYGDPKFYEKVGFRSISSEVVRPPYELSQPEGWLGQALCDRPIDSLRGSSKCVEALNNPVYW